ncbi:hypothetical protein M9Y10_015538 [Tritrichomonas musculus]|uniref:Guanylate cyclase domain-containing protein n=1 Tax=Tritrichomonas musculus TaxID=1915356 RepID=A0ABR2L2J8_9EUKA
MKADMTTSSTTANSISFVSSNNDKYGGILEKSATKLLRKEISELISYVYSVSPPFTILHYVVLVIRYFQLLGPSLNPGYHKFWETDYYSEKFLYLFSIFFYIVPPKEYDKASLPMMIIYIIITFALILTLIICAKIYKKKAYLPSFIPPIICFYFSSLGFILPPIAMEVMFSKFSKYIFDSSSDSNYTRTVVILVIAVIITVIYLFIFLTIALQVLTFQPMSLMTLCTMPQNMITLAVLSINFFMGLSEYSNQTITIIFCALAAVLYALASLIVFYKGGLVKQKEAVLYFSCCLTGFVTVVIIIVFQVLKKNATLIIIGAFIAIFVMFVFLSGLILKKNAVRRLRKLDKIMDDADQFESQVKSVNSFINLVVTGFAELHPICLNWSLLKMGIEKWPKNGEVWFVYAKFCAIYPEETQTLAWIFRSIITNKVKGQAARTVKGQSLAVARQREANLSPDLKQKLNSITKHVTGAKHKLRNVWDMAIQGNISDMEIATKRAIKGIKSSDGSLMHVLRLFPNNRFVTRQYARFCKELLADFETYADMIEKSRMLQRNVIVNKDQTHEYGILAFPNLPDKLNNGDRISLAATNIELSSSVIDLDEGEGESQEREESSVFLSRIEKLRIPSTFGMSVITLLLYFILFAAPVIIILCIIPMYIDGLTEPMQYMSDLAMARTIMYQIIAFGLQVLCEKFGVFEQPKGMIEKPPENFGSTFITYKQLGYLCKEMTLKMQNLDAFRTYDIANEHMKLAKQMVFSPVLEYTFFSKTKPTLKNISLTSALADIVSQQRQLITNETLDPDFVNTSAILNPSTSMTDMADKFNEALSLMILFISDNDKSQQKMIQIIMIAAICVSALLFILTAFLGVRWVQSNKEESYRCFTALPKNEVSQLAENLRILKKETENSTSTQKNNTEMNKQEDNILKMFMTGGTNGANSHDSLYISIILLIIMALQIVSVYLLADTMKKISSNLRQNSPHLNYLQGMYANLVAATTCITSLIGFSNNATNISNADKNDLLRRIDARLLTTRTFYNQARYGGSDIEDPPFSAFQHYVDIANELFACPNEYLITTNIRDATFCYSALDIVILAEAIYRSFTVPYQQDPEHFPYLPNDDSLRMLWDLLIWPVYDVFIFPMSDGIIETITNDLNDMKNGQIIYLVILLAVGFVFEIALLFILHSIDNHIRDVLKLLLHCQPKVIASTPKVMHILNGNFKKNGGDNGTRTAKFYDAVCDDLPDAIVLSNQEQIIIKANKSATRIFGQKVIDQIMEQKVTDFLSPTIFGGNVKKLLDVQPQKPITEILTHVSSETNSVVNIEATSTIINDGICFAIRDITQTVRYNTLIKEEKQKSDQLLGSILPASLVPRVQAGEKNISFAVQSATIVFMDIVSFTPWCGSLPAEKVMSTLNLLFMKNDKLVAKYPTMTKIKCIGDCYMAAGGVFADVNQPSVHAKEVVNFGLDALDAISELNKELNESLRIRVGINTGGPIVAGVLGIGKPTFEILGPAINMAQQMEHHGVPSQVHVSRSVYELIYGDSFNIKERGQIEVKNGTVVTYLVNRK